MTWSEPSASVGAVGAVGAADFGDVVGVGDAVELRVRFTGGWSAGFVVAAKVDGGYRVRRMSDGTLLPGVTGSDDLRRLGRSNL